MIKKKNTSPQYQKICLNCINRYDISISKKKTTTASDGDFFEKHTHTHTHHDVFFHFKAHLWQRTTTAMRISGFQHLWRLRSLASDYPTMVAIFQHNEVCKGDEIHIRLESQFFQVDSVDLFFFDLFFSSRYANSSCSLQFSWGVPNLGEFLLRCILQPFTDPFRSDESRGHPKSVSSNMAFPEKKSNFFGRYLKDLKVLDVKTSDFFRLFGAFLFPLPTEVHDGFFSDFGMSNVGALSPQRWKIVGVGFTTWRAVSGAEDWRLFEKPSKKQWRKSWRPSLKSLNTSLLSVSFFKQKKQHRFFSHFNFALTSNF